MGSVTNDDASKHRPPTIVDVAERAGVAIGTVSRYLQGKPVRRGNREQIEVAIQALRFRRSAVATAMRTDRTQVIGLLAPSFFEEYHGVLLEHLSRAIRREGRALLVYCHGRDPKVMVEGLDFFAARQVDALVMSGTTRVTEQMQQLVNDGLPVVICNNDLPGVPVSRVFVDNRKASNRAVKHLLDLGHRRIALLSGNRNDSTGKERYLGYEDALRERGLKLDPAYVADGDWTVLGGEQAAKQLMEQARPPTAIFSANGPMTNGALKYFRENGHVLPDDVSLISFDDSPVFSLHRPGITAVAQPIAAIAESISDLVSRRLSDPSQAIESTVVLDCDIILRESTRSPVGKR
ncbi:LacI family transcriptional regulator [Trinickia terrae]|uniref:LacI family transcriptional regulator n=2 Tax=Trinickia terrae TaxID=2571161 RepID=A0A4U1I679_9BURK|nr:LacI family transcriptional regulator [Trinickia terrae]